MCRQSKTAGGGASSNCIRHLTPSALVFTDNKNFIHAVAQIVSISVPIWWNSAAFELLLLGAPPKLVDTYLVNWSIAGTIISFTFATFFLERLVFNGSIIKC